jgi:chromosome segregation ATPase
MDGSHPRSFLRRLFGSWGESRPAELAELEERDWRRRMLLASRRIQGVQMALSADAADVRGLKAKLTSARPAVERLNAELGAAREAAQALSARLAQHLEVLQARPAPVVAPADLQRLHALETELERTRRELHQALLAARSDPRAAPAPGHDPTLQGELAAARQRIVGLELQLRGLEADRVELSQTRALMQRVQEEAMQRASFLESRLRSTEELQVQSQVGHERREQELLNLLSSGEERIRDLEGRLAAAMEARELDRAVHDLPADVDGRIEELTGLVAEFEQSREETRRVYGKELAEQTARLLELEAFCQELGKVRDELVSERDRLAGELAEVQARWRGIEDERRELEERQRRLLADADAAREAELEAIRAEREALRVQGEERARQHAEEVLELSAAHQRVVEKLQKRLRESEMSRVELETRAQREMIDFADHSRARIRALEGSLRERELDQHALEDAHRQLEESLRSTQALLEQKEREAEELARRVREAEERSERPQFALKEVENTQGDVRSAGQRLGERTTRLLDIMRDPERGSSGTGPA